MTDDGKEHRVNIERTGWAVGLAFCSLAFGETTQLRSKGGRAGHPFLHCRRTAAERSGDNYGWIGRFKGRIDAIGLILSEIV